jgi:hypothetical protein
MEPASPARLYAAAAGLALLALGIIGFFYDASFGGLDSYAQALGAVQVNGWLNLLYLTGGALGLLLAEVAARRYALAMGLVFTALAIIGWGTGWLQLAIGLLGLAAAAGTPGPAGSRQRRPRRLKPRAKPAGKRA